MKKVCIAIALALASGCADAQDIRHHKVLPIGDSMVRVNISNAYMKAVERGEVQDLEVRYQGETDQVERERLAQRLWEYGDSAMLYELASARLRRMDLVGAYAHYFALVQIAKTSAGYNPPDPEVRGPQFARLNKLAADTAKRMTPEQRKRGEQEAARLLRSNPNCCLPL